MSNETYNFTVILKFYFQIISGHYFVISFNVNFSNYALQKIYEQNVFDHC